MSNHYHHHQQPAFYGTIPAGGELAEALAQTSSSDGAVSSLGDEPLNESDMGRSNDLSDTAMEVGSVADSEISSLYPCDSISQRGEQVEHPPPSETKGEDSASDIHSFISEDNKTLFKKLHGRAFTSQSDGYMLPADDKEHSRLDLQHNVLKCHLRSLYPHPRWVEWLLRPDQERQPAVLDVGAGSGRCDESRHKRAVDMASQFPHAKVLGIDLVPPVLLGINTIPHNCRFEVDDANLSMAHYKDCFDVVHVRAADQGINDYKGFIYEIARTIRPHGILILCMANPQFMTEDLVPFPVTEPGEEGNIVFSKQSAYTKALPGCRNSSIGLIKRFTIAVLLESMQHFIGKGLDETETWVAEAMKINLMHAFEAFRPLLLTDGISPEDVEVMVQGATAELRDQTVHAVIQWKYCTAIRRDIHWHERLEVAEPLNRATETLIVDPSPPGTKSVAARSVGFPPKKG
ncbi:hypothetical protein FRB97_006499 [Tulasnella sp. 331]|nr:hypothetical protein FRB97_006499 [Tulasnella sp. 331]